MEEKKAKNVKQKIQKKASGRSTQRRKSELTSELQEDFCMQKPFNFASCCDTYFLDLFPTFSDYDLLLALSFDEDCSLNSIDLFLITFLWFIKFIYSHFAAVWQFFFQGFK